MANLHESKIPTEKTKGKRYGRALRRLLLRRTRGISEKHARQFARDGLVTVVGFDGTPCPAAGKGPDDRSSVRKIVFVRLTLRGYLHALALVGWNPHRGRPVQPLSVSERGPKDCPHVAWSAEHDGVHPRCVSCGVRYGDAPEGAWCRPVPVARGLGKCQTCGRELSTDDPRSLDCGGDCLQCMADAGDPDAERAIAEIARAVSP